MWNYIVIPPIKCFSDILCAFNLFSVCFSAVFEFMCDLTYNVTMSLIHTSVQGAVFQAVLRQEIAFFDATSTGRNNFNVQMSESIKLFLQYSLQISN